MQNEPRNVKLLKKEVVIMKCLCGNDTFYAYQVIKTMIVVDGKNNFVSNPMRENPFTKMHEEFMDVCEYESPCGPYVCTACGREYENIE